MSLSQEVQFLRKDNQFLRGDRNHYRREWYFTQQRLNQAQECNQRLREQNKLLKQQNQELRAASAKGAGGQPGNGFSKIQTGSSPAAKKPGARKVIQQRCVRRPITLTFIRRCRCPGIRRAATPVRIAVPA